VRNEPPTLRSDSDKGWGVNGGMVLKTPIKSQPNEGAKPPRVGKVNGFGAIPRRGLCQLAMEMGVGGNGRCLK